MQSNRPLHNVLRIVLPKRFSIPHNVLMQPKSFGNLRGAELFQTQFFDSGRKGISSA